MCDRANCVSNRTEVHNYLVIKFIRVLHGILFAAGYLAIAVLASVISYYGKPELGLGIILTATAMWVTLVVSAAVINRRHKRAVRSAEIAKSAAGPDTPKRIAPTPRKSTSRMLTLSGH